MNITMEQLIASAKLMPGNIVVYRLENEKLHRIYYSESVTRFYGIETGDMGEVLSDNAFNRIVADERERVVESVKRCIMEKTEVELNYRMQHETKGLIWIHGIIKYVGEMDDYPIIVASLSNVTIQMEKNLEEEKQKEQLYRETKDSETRLRNAVLFTKLLIGEYDPATHTFFNDNGWLRKCGFDKIAENVPESIIQKAGILPESQEAFRQLFRDIDQEKEDITAEIWTDTPGMEQKRCYEISFMLEKDADGKTVRVQGFAKDITESKNAEEAYEQRINAIFQINPDAVSNFIGNVTRNICGEGRSVYANIERLRDKGTLDGFVEDAMEYITEAKEQEAFRKNFSRKAVLQKVKDGIEHIHLEHHYLLENGRDEWVRSIMELIKNPTSGDVEFTFQTVNVHRMKVMDVMFRSVAKREYDMIAAIYTDTDDYMLLNQENDYMIEKCKAFESSRLAYVRTILTEDDERELILQKYTWENILKTVEEEGEFLITFCITDDQGCVHRKKERYSYIDKERNILLMTGRDITDLYLSEKKQETSLKIALSDAKKASQAKSEFLSQVSHDIRTPLNGITGMLQLAKLDDNLEQVHGDIDQAFTSAEFLLGLINDILDMSKIEAGKIELEPEPYDFPKFEEYLDVVIRPLCRKRNLEFTAYAEIPDTEIMVDILRFNQIFFNLLSNSAKYTLPGGKIQFECKNYRPHGENVLIDFYVRDNGIGMSKEFQKKLFQTFTQEHRDIARGTQGTGLGLAITKSLVDLMGGTISVQSKINQGSEFKVTLELSPVKKETKSASRIQKQEITQMHKKEYDFKGVHMLLCEDNEINQQIAIRLLEWVDAEVDVACDGKEGVSLFQESEEGYYDIVLMDIQMPVMDGLTATEHIRKLDRADVKTVPIVAMTANALSAEKQECLDAGMNGHLMKPIDMQKMYETIASFIKK